jgi:hypothetical protein
MLGRDAARLLFPGKARADERELREFVRANTPCGGAGE